MNYLSSILLLLILSITSIYSSEETPAPLPCPFIESVNVITGQYSEFHTDLTLGGSRSLRVQRAFYGYADGENENALGWHFNHHGVFNPEKNMLQESDGEETRLSYEFDGQKRPTRVEVKNLAGNKTFNWMTFSYEGEEEHQCHIEGSDGQRLTYLYQKDTMATRGSPPLLLNKVLSPCGGETTYSYVKHPTKRKMLIERRAYADNRFVEIDYYTGLYNFVAGEVVTLSDPIKDRRIGNVKNLKAPVGTDDTPIVTHSFIYHDDHTIVFDADRNMTIYRYSPQAQLTAIERYTSSSETPHALYSKEVFFWSAPKDNIPSRFIGHGLAAANEEIKTYTSYVYDEEGNLVEEILYGNLTGECTATIKLNDKGVPADNGIETARTTYEYQRLKKEGPFVLTKKTTPNGLTTQYLYEIESGRQLAIFLCEGYAIRVRQFYFYNQDGLLIKTVSDDGDSINSDDTAAVTERHIVHITLREEAPAIGMPATVTECYAENGTGGESVQKKTVYTYADDGQLARQEVYDGNGGLIGTIEQEYDEQGRCIRSVDANGSSQEHQYDAVGNIIKTIEKDETGNFRVIKNQYDFSNRLIHTEETTETGSTVSSRFHYNKLSQKIASIDSYGNETLYSYDSFSRLTRLTHPEVRSEKGNWYQPSVINRYDIFGNIISTIDPSGYETHSLYNSRKMPVEVLYPNGTREKYLYHKDGSLHKHYQKNGMSVVTQNDFLGRNTLTEYYGSDGALLYTITNEYSSFHLIRTTDSRGIELLYEYHSNGKQAAVTRTSGSSSQRTEYFYDSQGRLNQQKEWMGEDAYGFTLTINEYDAKGNIVETRIEDASGNILRQTKIEKEEAPKAKAMTRNLIAHNVHQQLTPQELTTDEKGNCTITTLDALGRIEKVEKTDSMGTLFEEKEIIYDPSGNKIREIHTVLTEGKASRPYTIAWKYGPCHRLESMTEGLGASGQRTTLYGYDKYGTLNKITKPDGVVNTFTFDNAGRLKTMESSDHSCSYIYTYDPFGNMINIHDNATFRTTVRFYDDNGNITEELLANNLIIKKEFDKKNRMTQLSLPDNSSISYAYDRLNLQTITRHSSSGEALYSHSYDQYDLEGKPHLSHLAKNAGTVNYSFDQQGRFTSISSPYWQEQISYNSAGASRIDTTDPAGSVSVSLKYDSAGQLLKESSEEDRLYSYDMISNRISHNSAVYRLGPCNELLFDGKNTFKYDANGNMIALSNTEIERSFRYDALNRLINVTQQGAWRVDFSYDTFNRRLTKKYAEWGDNGWTLVSSERYLYDGEKEIGTVDDAGLLTSLRVLGIGLAADIGAAIAMEIDDKLYLPLHNHRGTVCCLVDADTLSVAEFSRFTHFGEEVLYNSLGEEKEATAAINPWRFSSKRTDTESGLVLFGQRYYAPEQGRWITLDPLGTPDGPNRYTFSKNNPVSHLDLFGLYSWKSFVSDFTSVLSSCYNAVVSFTSKILNGLKSEAEYIKKIRPSMTAVFEKYFGVGFLTLSGFYSHPMETGQYGQGEINDKTRITFINGILNVRSSFRQSLELMSHAHGGTNIHYIFRPTDGWCWDMLQSILIKFGYISPYARELAATWKNLIQEMGGVEGGGTIIHYCHSLGGADTLNAARLLSPEERQMIHVISLGSAAPIHNNIGFYTTTNYVSIRDAIPYSDPVGYIKAIFCPHYNTVFVGSFLDGLPLIDHKLNSPTYTLVLTNLGFKFLEMYSFVRK